MSARILVMMSGSISAYKICHVLSRLKQAGHEIEVVATSAALQFVGEATIEGLTGRPVHKSMFGTGAHMAHINLIRWADLAIVCPATANTINKLSHGVGDDLITTLFLAHDFTKPWLIAPAMNSKMYHHPVTRAAVAKLHAMGCEILETASGVLACGEIGDGKLLDSELILAEISRRLPTETRISEVRTPDEQWPASRPNRTRTPGNGKHILITSGGTREPIDPVRAITNTSSGKTGAVVAEAMLGLGHSVYFLSAEDSAQPRVIELGATARFVSQHFRAFDDLAEKLEYALRSNSFDAVIHTAAVADYTLADGPSLSKNDSAEELILKFKKTPKLITELREWSKRKDLKIIAFKLTATNSKSERAEKMLKLIRTSKPDYVVANDISELPAWHLFKSEAATKSIADGNERESLGFALEGVL